MSKKLTWIGIAITAAYLVAAALLGWGEWDKFSDMKPNEVGDFLAGVVGPLALLWLILGYFQQGEELKQSTEALRLQAEELRSSVEQQHALVEVTKLQVNAQIEAFEREREEQRRALSPLFILAHAGGYGSGDGQQYKFSLRNHGATVTQFTAWFEGRKNTPPQLSKDVLPHQGELTFSFADKREDLTPMLVRMAFMDGGGHRGVRTFSVGFSPSKEPMLNDVSVTALPD
ncbi:hypothetical protein LP085_03650 [Achromobacter sp. MY14]|uniref:hypothetical protein n=1 Tax=Achromobacter TaxID=222 RepID=UPI000F8FB9CC|nr:MULTISPECIES: hypothetical protein [Achromobacter]AZS78570.1 hypothetical protein ELS24_09025 [Achromobacter spanius]MCD0495938.1 hypothetical protein [Achromobacter sp. MY14]